VASNKEIKYSSIAPADEWKIKQDATFFHFCQNETIQGFEFKEFPFDKIPEGQLTVCDMSSNFASRKVEWEKFDVVYVGAQKNVGPSGLTIVILKNEILQREPRKDIPLVSNWSLFSKAANMFENTPCCWAVYMAGLNIAYMLEQGGLDKMSEMATARSCMLYDYIDNSEGFYTNGVSKEYRSRMNVPFRVNSDEKLEKQFVADADAAGLICLSGHKSVGGCRASLYNAMPLEGVEALVAFMKEFKTKNC
jgi:phosphoserine aminotransferase